MAYSLVCPNTFALKLKIHCKICEKNLKNMLLKIQGVHSVKIDEKLGNLVISGRVDPATILTMLEKLGRKAELLWEQGHPINDSKNVINPLNDPDITTQLEQLTRIPGLQTVEVTKTIKLSFQGESRNELPGDEILEISTTKNVKGSWSCCGGFCGASSSCCGGHAAINHSHNHHGCCHGGNTSFGSCCANSINCCYGNWVQPLPMTPPPPPWSTTDTIPSAPPLPSEYFQAPPSPQSSSSMPHTYYSVLSNENVNGCIII